MLAMDRPQVEEPTRPAPVAAAPIALVAPSRPALPAGYLTREEMVHAARSRWIHVGAGARRYRSLTPLQRALAREYAAEDRRLAHAA